MSERISAIILAAGKGTRMNVPDDQNKVAYELAGQPMIKYSVSSFETAGIHETIVVIGHGAEAVRKALGDTIKYAIQAEQLGTADALKTGLSQVSAEANLIISAYGDDSAFYTPELINSLIDTHQHQRADVTFVTISVPNPTGLGRIIRNQNGDVTAIIEEKDATTDQKQITEINTGLYCFSRDFLQKYISAIKPNPITGEYYLTDIVALANQNDCKVATLTWPDSSIWFGVNTKEQLEAANQKMHDQIK